MNKIVKRITMTAMFASLICVATMVIKIPTSVNGYINIGDCVILLTSYFLPPVYSFFAAAIGSCLADLFSGYFVYAPVTFVIKGLMAVIAYFINKKLSNKINENISIIISGLIAELFMVGSYFIFEGFMYSFASSIVNVPLNLIQAGVGLVLSFILYKSLKKVFIEELKK